MCTWSFQERKDRWGLGEAQSSGLTPPPPPRARPKGRREPSGDVAVSLPPCSGGGCRVARVKSLIAAAGRGGGPSPGLSPTWLHFFGRKDSQGLRTLGAPLPAAGAGALAHFRALGLADASLALRSRTARGGQGSSGLIPQACIVAQWSVIWKQIHNPDPRYPLPGKPGIDPGPPNNPNPNLVLPSPPVGAEVIWQPERRGGWSV